LRKAVTTGSPYQRKPTSIFISFNHNPRDTTISGWMEEALNEVPDTKGLRILSSPLYGMTFNEEIEERISQVDAVVTLWSPEATRSFWVIYELYVASQKKKPVLLIEYDSQALPNWWGPERHNVRLVGMTRAPSRLPFAHDMAPEGNVYATVTEACAHFARQVREGKGRVISIPKPDPSGYSNAPRGTKSGLPPNRPPRDTHA
jgi:MTH538 TIR-like domain (DUF1863)